MLEIRNKRGQMGGLAAGVTTIVVVGLLVAICMYVLSTMGNAIDTDDVAGSVANETGYLNQTGYTLAKSTAGLENYANPVIVSVLNATSNATIGAGNYTLTNNVLRNATATNWPSVRVTYTYTYTESTAASNASDDVVTNLTNFVPWLGIILLVLAAGIVLFFVIRSFTGKGV
jgi:hypothetical protein